MLEDFYSSMTAIDSYNIRNLRRFKYLAGKVDALWGYVYVMHMENTPYYKIGYSKAPRDRIREIGGARLPLDIVLLHTIETNDMQECERYLHRLYKDKHHRGEWYTLGTTDLADISAVSVRNYELVCEAESMIDRFEQFCKLDVRSAVAPPLKRVVRSTLDRYIGGGLTDEDED